MNLNAYMQRVYGLEKSCYEQQLLLSKMSAGLQQAKNPRLKGHTEDKDAKINLQKRESSKRRLVTDIRCSMADSNRRPWD